MEMSAHRFPAFAHFTDLLAHNDSVSHMDFYFREMAVKSIDWLRINGEMMFDDDQIAIEIGSQSINHRMICPGNDYLPVGSCQDGSPAGVSELYPVMGFAFAIFSAAECIGSFNDIVEIRADGPLEQEMTGCNTPNSPRKAAEWRWKWGYSVDR